MEELPQWLPTCVFLLFFTVGVSALLSLVRPVLRHATASSLSSVLVDLWTYSPAGAAGQIQAVFVVVVGPAVLLLAASSLRRENDRKLLRNAFLFGLTIAVVSPIVQILLALPAWARPDLDTIFGYSLSALFRDPHSYAAYLVLGIGCALGASLGWIERNDHARAATGLLLAGAALVILLYTNSRSGLVAVSITVIAVLARARLRRERASRSSLPLWLRTTCLVTLISMIVVATLVVVSPAVRAASYNQLVKLGNPHMWSLLRSDSTVADLRSFYVRQGLLEKAGFLIQTYPIWGIGPKQFELADVPVERITDVPIADQLLHQNAHNYYIQLGAEYGIPVLLAFLTLIGATLTTVARASWRRTDPLEKGILSGIVAGQVGFLAFSVVSHPLLLPEMQALYWTLAGLGVATAIYSPTGRDADDLPGIMRIMDKARGIDTLP